MKKITGKQLVEYTKEIFGVEEVTPSQIDYTITMLDPVAYALTNHTAKGHKVTFDIPNYDASKAVGHRPWQKEILRAVCDPNNKDVTVMKSRQLGLTLSPFVG